MLDGDWSSDVCSSDLCPGFLKSRRKRQMPHEPSAGPAVLLRIARLLRLPALKPLPLFSQPLSYSFEMLHRFRPANPEFIPNLSIILLELVSLILRQNA
jgi:hypothetical protein